MTKFDCFNAFFMFGEISWRPLLFSLVLVLNALLSFFLFAQDEERNRMTKDFCKGGH